MTTAVDVARHLIRLAAEEPDGEPMTAARLHKLLYYCQGWHLAWYGRPLFAERIEAWRHGPVVPDVWNLPWGQGRGAVPEPGGANELPAEAARPVEQVWRHFRKFSACGLRELTRREAPWRDHYRPDATDNCNAVIPTNELAAYFGTEYRRQTGEEPGAEAAGALVSHDQMLKELGW
jgi:uncharacterized phage-associated protein